MVRGGKPQVLTSLVRCWNILEKDSHPVCSHRNWRADPGSEMRQVAADNNVRRQQLSVWCHHYPPVEPPDDGTPRLMSIPNNPGRPFPNLCPKISGAKLARITARRAASSSSHLHNLAPALDAAVRCRLPGRTPRRPSRCSLSSRPQRC